MDIGGSSARIPTAPIVPKRSVAVDISAIQLLSLIRVIPFLENNAFKTLVTQQYIRTVSALGKNSRVAEHGLLS